MRHEQSLSPKDWQLLSEYMDGQLSSRDQARLEQRLNEREDLRAALDELRRTRAVLRSVKLKRVPRNFTLTPAMLPQPRPNPFARLIPVLNFTSALSALAMVVALVIGLLPGLSPSGGIRAAQEAPASATDMSTPEMAAGDTAAPIIIEWVPAYGLGGGGGGEGVSTMMEQQGSGGVVVPPETIEIAPPAAAMPVPEQKAPGATPEPDMTRQMVPTQPAAGVTAAPAAEQPAPESVSQAPLEGAGPILGVRPESEARANNQAAVKALSDENRAARPVAFPWIIPALLALIAAGSWLTVRILRRKFPA